MQFLFRWIQKIKLVFTANKIAKQKELALLEKQLKIQQQAKRIFINEQNFEAAKWYKEKERLLEGKINALKQTI